ncbi:hypothetical protein [Photobacterium gaetbulicola]|uniref:hypothetical protein n=1 Tax=Photobacterium gaetbulicola TaxID=1295392 RepID=UPI0012DFFC35|nr:hypothetical protein [Photobacterium gaetbulicola]
MGGEINGLITYIRKALKVILEVMKETHQELYQAFGERAGKTFQTGDETEHLGGREHAEACYSDV